ncbi:hypothetical protein ACIBAI_27295 [Streptomyces sp. NPDC051041]|uniref:hypothetical protein n=1 Tax=Streptomyces sp. NPDC051041 TaxID=3365640 RepID=UPI00379FD4AE
MDGSTKQPVSGRRPGGHGVTGRPRGEARKHCDDRAGALVRPVAPIGAATRTNVIVHHPGGPYRPGRSAGTPSRPAGDLVRPTRLTHGSTA